MNKQAFSWPVLPNSGVRPTSLEPPTWTTFSGQDIKASALLRLGDEIVAVSLGNLYTFSYSSYRDIVPVRGCGQASALAHVKGARTVSGTLVFTQFNEDALLSIISTTPQDRNASGFFPVLHDQIPPFTIMIICSGEVRRGTFSQWRDPILVGPQQVSRDRDWEPVASRLVIYGCSLAACGSTMSVDDLVTEQIFNYHALGFGPLTDINGDFLRGSPQSAGDTGSKELMDYKEKLGTKNIVDDLTKLGPTAASATARSMKPEDFAKVVLEDTLVDALYDTPALDSIIYNSSGNNSSPSPTVSSAPESFQETQARLLLDGASASELLDRAVNSDISPMNLGVSHKIDKMGKINISVNKDVLAKNQDMVEDILNLEYGSNWKYNEFESGEVGITINESDNTSNIEVTTDLIQEV